MLMRIEKDDMRCEDCGVDFSRSVLNLVALLVERRPRWCKDLVKGKGMGRYSVLTVEMLEELFRGLLAQGSEPETADKRGDTEMVVRIIDGFPEWASKAAEMRSRLNRAKKIGGEDEDDRKGFYGIHRPVEAVPFCLVPYS